jgi:hypothetical protein
MKITITDTPATLQKLLHAAGYVYEVSPNAWLAVSIRNVNYSYAAWVYTFVVNPPVFIEWANLKKLQSVAVGSTDFFTQSWDTVDQVTGKEADPRKYITEWEGYSILDRETHNFVSFDLDEVFLTTCPWETVQVEVALF